MARIETNAPAPRKADQDAEREMRDKHDRATQERPNVPEEPRYRDGADRTDIEREGWSEVEGSEEPPRGGHRSDPGDVETE